MDTNKVYLGDSLEVIKTFPDESIDCVVTSPPYYGLRDYGTGEWVGGDMDCKHEAAKIKTCFDYDLSDLQKNSKGTDVPMYRKVCPTCGAVRVDKQIGSEDSPEEYIEKMVSLFREIRRCLKKDGTCWVNLGDSYNGYKANRNGGHNDSPYVGGHGGHPTRESGYGLESKNLKPKDLIGIPWMFAFAMRADGWYLRQDIIWSKPNPMPESVTDRCTKSHEYIFLFSKSEKYYFDHESIQEPATMQDAKTLQNIKFGGQKYGDNEDSHFAIYSGNSYKPKIKPRTKNMQYDGQKPNTMHEKREMGLGDEQYLVRNKRDVWNVNVKPTKEAHFATYPQKLISPCILAGCRKGGIVLDPFMGSGTTGIVARKLGRKYVGVELNPEYLKMAERRIAQEGDNLFSDI